MKHWLPCLSALFAGLLAASSCFAMPDFKLPDGFIVEELVSGVPNARSMSFGDEGTLFVSTRRAGNVYAVRNALSGNPEVLTIAEGLKIPNGIAFRGGDLYVATMSQLLRFDAIEEQLQTPGEPTVVDAALPFEGKRHVWKYIAFGPDGKLYVSLGAPCNVCDKPSLSAMLRMNADGSDREIFAYGIRNSVGFAWHPETGDLWFSDNGRDMLGDDVPPCELNRITAPGQHFGFPFCHGASVTDPEFGALGRCEDAVAPAQELAPHSAPLGIRFYSGEMFPDDYVGSVFIAEHGSWNRSEAAGKTGYRVSLVRLEDSRAVSYTPFMEGFLTENDKPLGRPVDVLVAPDGALLVSDDLRGVIYRISYEFGSE